jgi:hypothetical protein
MKSIEKLSLCTFVGCLLLSQTVFSKQPELAAKVKACSQVSDNLARLNCFDQLTTKQNYQAPLSKKTTSKVELTAQQVDSFSKEQVEKTAEEKAKEIKAISLTISSLGKNQRDKWKITFDNGQKWQQTDAVKLKLKKGEEITLTKGALSSVYLQKEGSNKRIKVKRLK